MLIDNIFAQRLLHARHEKGLTQSKLAEMVGITQRAIVLYEKNQSKPREKILFNLAYVLGVTPNWLANGSRIQSDENKVWDSYNITDDLKQIPLYDIDELDIDLFTLSPMPIINNKLFEVRHLVGNKRIFALKIKGNSMALPNNIGFPDGSIVICGLQFKKQSGSFYIIKMDNLYSFKQLFIDDFRTRIKPLNTDYPEFVVKNDEYEILAKAVYVEIDLTK